MNIHLLQKANIKGAGLSLLLESNGHKVEIISERKKKLRFYQTELTIVDIEHFITTNSAVMKYNTKCSRIILLGKLYHLHCLKNFQSTTMSPASGFVSLRSKPLALLKVLNKIKENDTCFCFDNRTQNFLQRPKLVRQNNLLQECLNESLTKTELKVLREISEGLTSENIAEKWYRSIHTIQNHRKNIKHKFKNPSACNLIPFSILNKNAIKTLLWITENYY